MCTLSYTCGAMYNNDITFENVGKPTILIVITTWFLIVYTTWMYTKNIIADSCLNILTVCISETIVLKTK